MQKGDRKNRYIKKTTLLIGFIIMLISAIMLITLIFPTSQKALIYSIFLLVLVLLVFIKTMERKTSKSRQIAILSVFTALTVVANLLNFTALPINAGTAVVILTGVMWGANSGFIVGILARFIINLFYLQGMWTLWQMLGWGIIGFIAGVLFYKQYSYNSCDNAFKKKKYRLSKREIVYILILIIYLVFIAIVGIKINILIAYLSGIAGLIFLFGMQSKLKSSPLILAMYGFLSALFIYGGLLNFSTVVMVGGPLTKEMILTIYAVGFPYDLFQAIGCAIFLFITSPFILDTVNRIKIKYNF